jgi:nucleotide-binding universal stress UspA family protein
MLKDILVFVSSYPRPTPDALTRAAVGIAGKLGAHITALIGDPDPIRPISFYRTMEAIKAESRSIHQVARESLASFQDEATRLQISHEGEIVTYTGEHAVVPSILERARTSDLTLLPFLYDDETAASLAERIIFGSGRPVLLLPLDIGHSFATNRIVVAWDFSRPAARALADSIPLLQRATEVRVVTIVRDKTLESSRSLDDVATHLLRHDIRATIETVDARSRKIDEVLGTLAEAADLLVMGAFGHSRMRDFVLGGATRGILQKPPVPVLLSH